MTREEAKTFAERVIDLGFKDETQEFCEFILKLLEQEPCEDAISRQAVLDKIRAEIEQLPTTICKETYGVLISAHDFKEDVLEIIDKYRIESEGDEE